MKIKNKKILIISLIFISFSLVSPLNRFFFSRVEAQASLPKPIPPAIYPCLPGVRQGRLKESEAFMRGYYKDKDKEYFVVEMLYRTTPPFEDFEGSYETWGRFFVTLDKIGCLALNSEETATDLIFSPLTQIVAEPIAKALALQWWKYQLKLTGNPEKLKRDLLIGLEPGPEKTVLFSEDIWALAQLGITFPPNLLNRQR